MIEGMYIGSSDAHSLLMNKKTKGYHELFKRFCIGERNHRDPLTSPIPQLKRGAIVEIMYHRSLSLDYESQIEFVHPIFTCAKCHVDFACKSDVNGEYINLKEVKSVDFDSFITLMNVRPEKLEAYIKTKYVNYYDQVQFQMYVSQKRYMDMVFICAISDDERELWSTPIEDNMKIEFSVGLSKDYENRFNEELPFFQNIYNHFHDIHK